MAMSNKERQARYREARTGGADTKEKRLNCWVSSEAAEALGELADIHGVSQRKYLETLLLAARSGARRYQPGVVSFVSLEPAG